jgi:hypothetical protein
MDIREQLHKVVGDLDAARIQLERRADIENLEDTSLQAALTHIRVLRNLLEKLGRSGTLQVLAGALINVTRVGSDALFDVTCVVSDAAQLV